MEDKRNIKEEIKVEIDLKNVHEKGISDRIYKYTVEKYKNILKEEGLIREILEYCRENDEEVRQEYLNKLEQLQKEKWIVFNKIKEMDNQEEMEK